MNLGVEAVISKVQCDSLLRWMKHGTFSQVLHELEHEELPEPDPNDGTKLCKIRFLVWHGTSAGELLRVLGEVQRVNNRQLTQLYIGNPFGR